MEAVRWAAVLGQIHEELAEWRTAHPKATLAEIEAAVEERLGRARAQLVEDLALASAAVEIGRGAERPPCPECGHAMVRHGQQARQVTVAGNRSVRLRRGYARCPACGAGLFPPG
jgi:YgiT-type zinc finger domain-containing protein